MAPPTVPAIGHGNEVTPPPLFVEGDKPLTEEEGVQTRPPEGRPRGFEKYNPTGFPYLRVLVGGPPASPPPPGSGYGLKGAIDCQNKGNCSIFYDGKGSAGHTPEKEPCKNDKDTPEKQLKVPDGKGLCCTKEEQESNIGKCFPLNISWASSEIVVRDSKAFQAAVTKLMSGQPGGGFLDLPGVSNLKSSPDGTNRWKLSWTTNVGLTISTSIVVMVKEGTNSAGAKFFQVKWDADPVGSSKPSAAYLEPNSGFLVVEMPEGKPWNLIWKISNQKLEYAHLAEGEQKGIDNKLGNTAEVRKGISDYVDALFIKIGGFAK